MTNVSAEQKERTVMMTSGVAVQHSHSEVVVWCKEYIARTLNLSIDRVDPSAEFDALGVDSAAAVALVMDIGAWLDRDIEPATMFEYPTISSFAEYLTRQ